MNNLPRIIFLSVVATLGGFLFGFDSGVINGTVDALKKEFNAEGVACGFNIASMLLGCAVGAFFAGNLADIFGRRNVLIVTAVFFIVSAWGSGYSTGSLEFILYRVLGGFAVGAASVLCPAYISEIAPAPIRGALAALQQMAIILGLFFAFLSNYLIATYSGGAESIWLFGIAAWSWMFWIEILPATLFLFALFLIPESPRFLVSAGRPDEAHRVLASVSSEEHAREKILEIEETLRDDPAPTELAPRLRHQVQEATSCLHHPIVWTGLGLAALQQLVGINVVFYYGAVLWQAAGFTESNALHINVISGSINIISTTLAILTIDRIGRKPLLMIGSIGMAVTLGLLAYIFAQAGVAEDGTLDLGATMGTAALITANAYVFFFGISWGPVMWVMLGEMFPNSYRGAALAVSGVSQWMTNFLVIITFEWLLSTIGLGGTYFIYTAFALLSMVFVWRAVNETKGMTLEEMKG